MSIATARAERQRLEEEQRAKDKDANIGGKLGTAAIAGGVGYLTGGIGNMLMGAGPAAAFAPTVANVGSAISSTADALAADAPPEKAAAYGLKTGMAPLEANLAIAAKSRDPENILKLGKMKTDIIKYAEPLQGTLDEGEELPADVFEMEGILPGVKYFKFRKQPNPIITYLGGNQ